MKRAQDEAKEAKSEAKCLKKELDESAAKLEKSKEHSQRVESRFRDVIGKLSGNFSSLQMISRRVMCSIQV